MITFENRPIKTFVDYTLFYFHNLQMGISNPSNNDVVILSNESIYHTSIPKYRGLRRSIVTISINVRPYLDKISGLKARGFVVIWRQKRSKRFTD